MSDQQKLDFMGYEGEAFAALQNAKHQQAMQQQEPNAPVVPHRVTSVYNKVKDYINSFRKKKN